MFRIYLTKILFVVDICMSLSKCLLTSSTRLVFLGLCDSTRRRFEVKQDKLVKLQSVLTGSIEYVFISLTTFEKLAGKCTSMSVTVTPVSLHTWHMYRDIVLFNRTEGKTIRALIKVPTNCGLRHEMDMWLEVRYRCNGTSWYDAIHHALPLSWQSIPFFKHSRV